VGILVVCSVREIAKGNSSGFSMKHLSSSLSVIIVRLKKFFDAWFSHSEIFVLVPFEEAIPGWVRDVGY